MFRALRGGSWQLGTQPASDKERQQRQALPSPPARPRPPAMRHRRQPQGRVHFRRLAAVFNARLLAADRYRLRCSPPLRTRLLRDCSLPGAHGLGAPGLAAEAARLPALTAWSPPWRGTGRRRAHPAASPKRTRAAHGLLPVAVATTRAGRLPTRPGGAACLCIFLLLWLNLFSGTQGGPRRLTFFCKREAGGGQGLVSPRRPRGILLGHRRRW